jgi:hypothetical protein
MKPLPDSMPRKLPIHAKPFLSHKLVDRVANVLERPSGPTRTDTDVQCLACDGDECAGEYVGRREGEGEGGVAVVVGTGEEGDVDVEDVGWEERPASRAVGRGF